MKRIVLIFALAMTAAAACSPESAPPETNAGTAPVAAATAAPAPPVEESPMPEESRSEPASSNPASSNPASSKSSPTPAASPGYAKTDMVPLTKIAPGIEIDLAFAGTDHPFGEQYYRANEAYLRYGTAQKLAEAQKILEKQGLGLKIWDSYRPFVVQEAIFQKAGGNANWVSDPYRKSGKKTHVRGVAVDCTIVGKDGKELDMPTPYLDFEHGAERMRHDFMFLSKEELANRKLLMDTMYQVGMEPYSGEWWHYQDEDWQDYPLIESKDFPDIHRELLIDRLYRKTQE